ncbi:DUF58 domain-containing protein [Pannus brasiliensis CCIBt3594]|uniref:DUF58 domain-containing protein n=1 Tax=Pannus brasiliensis CCIBt3594 TaxID=1427578 RepID=A0AAW9QTN7_9CHRO
MKNWLENHWVAPAYGGGALLAVTFCFFAAATNTMAGWLYAICGTSMALLGASAILPPRSLRPLTARRLPIEPVSAGDDLAVTIEIANPTGEPKTLLEVRDILPFVLAPPKAHPIESVPARDSYRWTNYIPTTKRGIYRWNEIQLRTATPLGLFWCSRRREVPARAVVYPRVLPLQQCPIVDSLGQDRNPLQSDRHYRRATEGFTRNLRQYRYGDPIRLIHWKTSARLGEFQVRELEILSGGQEVIVCLDTLSRWPSATFERAIVAAASLYFYASRRQFTAKLWTAGTGVIHGERSILETLAAVESGETESKETLPDMPVIWLTGNPVSIESLPAGSRWLFFPDGDSDDRSPLSSREFLGLTIDPERTLQQQLQAPLR